MQFKSLLSVFVLFLFCFQLTACALTKKQEAKLNTITQQNQKILSEVQQIYQKIKKEERKFDKKALKIESATKQSAYNAERAEIAAQKAINSYTMLRTLVNNLPPSSPSKQKSNKSSNIRP